MRFSRTKRPVLALIAAAGLALAGCATEPPYYGPMGPDHSTGYTDLQLDETHYQVTYHGDSSTPRDTVEQFLLLRSAQVAERAGYPYFMFDTRGTKSRTYYYTMFTGWPGWGGYGWYRWYGPPGMLDWDAQAIPVTRYEGYAEIVLMTPAQAQKEPRALDARSVEAHLLPLVAPPSSPPRQ